MKLRAGQHVDDRRPRFLQQRGRGVDLGADLRGELRHRVGGDEASAGERVVDERGGFGRGDGRFVGQCGRVLDFDHVVEGTPRFSEEGLSSGLA